MNNTYKEEALLFKALDDDNRLQILDILRGGEMCACILLEKLTIAQSTLSHHMKILMESGMVTARRDGKWMYYTLSMDGIDRAAQIIAHMRELSGEPFTACNDACKNK